MEQTSWFVAATTVGREREAAAQLSRFETFLPLTKVSRTVCRRIDTLQKAFFPGYFFLRCEIDQRPLKRNNFRGLVGINGPGIGEPLVVVPEAVDELRSQVDQRGFWMPPPLVPGTPVEIVGGDLYWGQRGLYECSRGEDRVIVLLQSLIPYRVNVHRNHIRELQHV